MRWGMAVLGVILMTSVTCAADAVIQATQPATQAAAGLEAIRGGLPKGWSIRVGEIEGQTEWIIEREVPVRVVYASPLAPQAEEKTLRIAIIVGPKVGESEYRQMVEFNAGLAKKYRGNEATLNRMAPWVWWKARTAGAENRPYLVPTHFDEGQSYFIDCGPGRPRAGSWEYKVKEDERETAGVLAGIVKRFQAYEAGEGRRGEAKPK